MVLGISHRVTLTHTPHYSSTKSVLLNPNRRQTNPPNDSFLKNWGPNVCCQGWFCLKFPMGPHPLPHTSTNQKNVVCVMRTWRCVVRSGDVWCEHLSPNTLVRQMCCSTQIVANPILPMSGFLEIWSPMCVANDGFHRNFLWAHTQPHTPVHSRNMCCLNTIVADPTLNDRFFGKCGSPCE